LPIVHFVRDLALRRFCAAFMVGFEPAYVKTSKEEVLS